MDTSRSVNHTDPLSVTGFDLKRPQQCSNPFKVTGSVGENIRYTNVHPLSNDL